MEKLTTRSFRNLFAAAALCLVVAPACDSRPGVTGTGEAFNRSGHALQYGTILEMNGTYGAGCSGQVGSWSVDLVSLNSPANPVLMVNSGNAACLLSLTSLLVGNSEQTAQTFVADMPIPLDANFPPTGTGFRVQPTDPVAFYANAHLLPDGGFNTDFTIELFYSDDPSQIGASVTAQYQVVSASAIASAVPVPDYGLSASNLTLQIGANNIITGVSGTVDLFFVSQPGDTYVISNTDLGANPSYAAIDAAFQAALPTPLPFPNPSFPAATFGLLGTDLSTPAVRDVIIARTIAGVSSYELVTVTMYHP